MSFDFTPGSLDGPPAPPGPGGPAVTIFEVAPPEKKKTNPVGFAFGIVVVLIPLVALLVGLVWATAWMLTHWPS